MNETTCRVPGHVPPPSLVPNPNTFGGYDGIQKHSLKESLVILTDVRREQSLDNW